MSWFVRKANGLTVYNRCNKKVFIEDQDWKTIQAMYDAGASTTEIGVKYGLSPTHISTAAKMNLFKPRSRNESRLLRLQKGLTEQPRHTEESRNNISKAMRKAVLEGRHQYTRPYGTKMTIYKMNNNTCGRLENLHCGWEKQVAEYMSLNNIKWCKPTQSFTYTFNDVKHEYFPDFFLPDYNAFIEVKGWKTDKDACKWEHFPHQLLVIDRKSINNLQLFFDTKLVHEAGIEPAY